MRGFLDRSSVTTASRYLNLMTVSRAYPLTVVSFAAPFWLTMFLVFSERISIPYAFEILSRCFTKVFSSVFVPARPRNASANRRLVMVLSPILTVPSWFTSECDVILSGKILKRVGESRHPCRTPTVVQNQLPR